MKDVLHRIADTAVEEGDLSALNMHVDWVLRASETVLPDALLSHIPVKLSRTVGFRRRSDYGFRPRLLLEENARRQAVLESRRHFYTRWIKYFIEMMNAGIAKLVRPSAHNRKIWGFESLSLHQDTKNLSE